MIYVYFYYTRIMHTRILYTCMLSCTNRFHLSLSLSLYFSLDLHVSPYLYLYPSLSVSHTLSLSSLLSDLAHVTIVFISFLNSVQVFTNSSGMSYSVLVHVPLWRRSGFPQVLHSSVKSSTPISLFTNFLSSASNIFFV